MLPDDVIHCVQDVHVKELVKRLDWSVKIRWYYIGISSLLILAVYMVLDNHGIHLHYEYLIVANVFIFFCNLFYQYQQRYSYHKCLGTHELRYYLLLQIVTDYLALMLVVYALGSIETPIILMIIPNSILSTLFFTQRQSLLITLSGMLIVITPLFLEYWQVIQVISIFENSFKTAVLADPVFLMGYVFILSACVVFCWYLLSSITSQLINNELELEQSYQDMLKLDEEKTHATLRSTHELKAPLAAIKSYVYTMNAGYAGDINDKVLKIINRIGKRCDFLLANVTDIIKLGNLKSYVVSDKQFSPFNLVLYLEKFLSLNDTLTHEKHITINVENKLKNADTLIVANEENLQLICSNLFTNAINYSHDNGVIDVVLSEQLYKGKEHLCMSIEDHGIGIAEKHLQQIFDEHFRANNAVEFYEGGTGLGLSIVKVCCQILGAKIQIKSILGKGTTVLIYFNVSVKNGGRVL